MSNELIERIEVPETDITLNTRRGVNLSYLYLPPSVSVTA